MKHIADEAEHIYIALGITDFRKQQNAQERRETEGCRFRRDLLRRGKFPMRTSPLTRGFF